MTDEKRSCLLIALLLASGAVSCAEGNGGGSEDEVAPTTDTVDDDDAMTSPGATCPTPPLQEGRYWLDFGEGELGLCHAVWDEYPAGNLRGLKLELRVSAEQGTLLCPEDSLPPPGYGCNGMALSNVGTEEEPIYRLQGTVWELLPAYWIEFEIPPEFVGTEVLVRFNDRSPFLDLTCKVFGGIRATIFEKP